MTTEREELATAIANRLDAIFGKREFGPAKQDYELADALIELGYRKPRTISEATELDELPVESVVLDHDGTACQKSHDYFDRKQWYAVGVEYAIAKPELPATVIHEGEA